MKIARYLSIPMLGLFVVTTGASADPSTSDTSDSPYTQTDPDGVPLSVTQPQSRPLSQSEINAIHQQQQQAAANKDWLLRSYEKQLAAHASTQSPDGQEANLYYQLSSDKELAKLAGLPALDSDSEDITTPYRTGASDPASVKLRTDTSPTTNGGFSSHDNNLFKPLLTPLSAPNAMGLNSSSPALPIAMAMPLSGGILPQPVAVPSADQPQDSSDLETPGMVAAKKDPLTDMSSSDLTLDILPGESIEQARAHQGNNSKLELPLPMDAGQLHNQQAAPSTVPGAPNAAKTAKTAPAPVNAVPIEDPNAPEPVSKSPQINPVRAPIASPFDILNR
jgi:hypothetical protein